MRLAAFALLLTCAVTFFAGLGRPAVGDSDEAFYAESAREMVESGDWLTPHYNYEYRFQKPILYYWLTAATFLVAGIGPGTARFSSALSGVGLVFITWMIARRSYDERTGLIAGLIVATCFGTFSMARLALPDLPLAFLATATIAALIAPEANWTLAAIAAALGFLMKGPLAVLLPALVLLPVLTLDRRLGELSPRKLIVPFAVFAAIAVPWYAAMTMKHGATYLYGFFVGDNLERFATDRYNEPRSIFFYLPIAAGGLMPWTPFALLWLRPIRRWLMRTTRVAPRERRLLIWIALPLLFFSVSVGKQPRYILPMLPPLTILLAESVARATERPGRSSLLTAAAAASGALFTLLAMLLWRARAIAVQATTPMMLLAALLIAAAGIVIVGHTLLARPRTLPYTVAAAAALSLAALQYSVLSSPTMEPVERVAAAIAQEHRASERTATYQALVRNLVFYTRFRQEDLSDAAHLEQFLASPDRVLCVLPERTLAEYEAAHQSHLRRFAEVPYFNVSTAKLKSLLWPDPTTDIETLVVVSNRDSSAERRKPRVRASTLRTAGSPAGTRSDDAVMAVVASRRLGQ